MIRAGTVAAALILPGLAMAQGCPPAPEPVFSLAYGSRYAESDGPGRILDEKADREVDEELGPIDDFLRDLTDDANRVFAEDTDRQAIADCVLSRMAVWARADAMGDLRSNTSQLTIGSRLAAFGLTALQAAPFATRQDDRAVVRDWLHRRQRAQMEYWETATEGAARGNLRAWAALAGSAIGELANDAAMLGWSAWSASYILCSAAPDGSLPQEMTRGRFALHYQLHAIAPLTVTAARLNRLNLPITGQCDEALRRAVGFALGDLEDGAQTRAITGEVQTFFDGSDEIEGFNLAFLEAYLTLYPDPAAEALAEEYRPLGHSKLGGDQTAIWRR
ncbi:alginate lyase family protein [Oceaniglobus trochenteri]|uniref:alginate lyase family protein n=1 Tax=Oceaniglobus trochenteri TaxID=2763260 RepID=UPI001CFFD72D|nr:alginate lyase family protein [Oceaniglobus trochenteri]